jgi:hypothetical protein
MQQETCTRDADKEQISFEAGGMGAKSYKFFGGHQGLWGLCCCCCEVRVLVLAPAVSVRLNQGSRYRGLSAFLVKPLPQILSNVDDAG